MWNKSWMQSERRSWALRETLTNPTSLPMSWIRSFEAWWFKILKNNLNISYVLINFLSILDLKETLNEESNAKFESIMIKCQELNANLEEKEK